MNNLREYENKMRFVMNYAIEKHDISDLSNDDRRILKHCFDDGYIEGLAMLEMISGRIVAEYRFDPTLTLKGHQFMESTALGSAQDAVENSAANNHKERNRTAKKAFHIVKAIFKRFWALFCGFGVVISVFGWSGIEAFFASLLSFFQ